jgi:hypothetical protein
MAIAPFSGSILILRENADGIHIEVYHWDNLADGTPVPPRGPITQLLTNQGADLPAYSFHTERMATTRADAIAKFTAYINAKFPDTA